MFNIKLLKTVLLCTAGLVPLSAGQVAQARSYAQPPVRCVMKPVVTYQYQKRRFTHFVTRYDHFGRPYRVRQVCYKTVRVPVTTWVRVCY